MNTMFPKLFERGKIGRVEIKNRIVKSPTQVAMRNPDGSVTDRMIKYYEEVARGGSGLIIVEGASVMPGPDGLGLSLAAPQYIPGLSFLAEVIQANSAKSVMQLLGGGGRSASWILPTPTKAPSRIPWEPWYFQGKPVPLEITVEEIHEIVTAYGNTAQRVETAGFDMVEIHGGHGGLITNFLSPAQNKRNDLYGGTLYNRMRFLVEIVREIRKKVSPDLPLLVRLSAIDYEPGGVVLEETLEVVKALEQNGVDAIDVSAGSHGEDIRCAPSMLIQEGLNVPAAAAVKGAVNIPVIVVGAITTPQLAEEILAGDKADFIALGRPLFADPNWPQKAKEGRPEDIVPCIRCNYGCHDVGPPLLSIRCTTNAALGLEERLPITPVERIKNVAVVGGGPGGMEAARVCALRGHNVTLYEKRKLGGALIEASVPEFKADIRRLISYYVTQMEKLKIKVIQEEATANTIKDGKFDAVIVAVGAVMRKPDIPGIDKPIVTDVLAVLNGEAKVGQRVHIVGGGIIGVEVGLFLAEQGEEIIFTTRQDELMTDIGHNRAAYEERLAGQKITIHTGRWLDSIVDKGSIVGDRYGNRQEILADSVVLASGFIPQTALRDQLEKEADLEVYAVGDCVSPRIIYDAIHEGFYTARML